MVVGLLFRDLVAPVSCEREPGLARRVRPIAIPIPVWLVSSIPSTSSSAFTGRN